MSCPVCGAQTKRLFLKHGYPIHECVACQHRAKAPQPCLEQETCSHPELASTDLLQSTEIPTHLADTEALQRYGWHYAEMFKAYMPLGTVLDVGAPAGFTLKGMLERGWHGVGLEADRQLADYGRARLGLPIMPGSIEQPLVKSAKKAAFDLIMMIQRIAYFQDLHQALDNAASLTHTNGFWYIETWDRTSWPAQLLGRYWHEYKLPNVLHWFSPAGVAKLAEQYGFVEVARGRPQKWHSGAHLKSRLQDKLHALPGGQMLNLPLAIIPDQLQVPQPSFDLFWILLQKRPKLRLYNIPTTSVLFTRQSTLAVAPTYAEPALHKAPVIVTDYATPVALRPRLPIESPVTESVSRY